MGAAIEFPVGFLNRRSAVQVCPGAPAKSLGFPVFATDACDTALALLRAVSERHGGAAGTLSQTLAENVLAAPEVQLAASVLRGGALAVTQADATARARAAAVQPDDAPTRRSRCGGPGGDATARACSYGTVREPESAIATRPVRRSSIFTTARLARST